MNLEKLIESFDKSAFSNLNKEVGFYEYLNMVIENPKLLRNAYQMIYDMIIEKGFYKFDQYRKTYTHYNFFDDSEIPIIGLEETKDELVKFIRGAAGGYGTEKRVLLLHGPVGSSKSTICRLLKEVLKNTQKQILEHGILISG